MNLLKYMQLALIVTACNHATESNQDIIDDVKIEIQENLYCDTDSEFVFHEECYTEETLDVENWIDCVRNQTGCPPPITWCDSFKLCNPVDCDSVNIKCEESKFYLGYPSAFLIGYLPYDIERAFGSCSRGIDACVTRCRNASLDSGGDSESDCFDECNVNGVEIAVCGSKECISKTTIESTICGQKK